MNGQSELLLVLESPYDNTEETRLVSRDLKTQKTSVSIVLSWEPLAQILASWQYQETSGKGVLDFSLRY